jgi:histidinol phosphatase-like PHP family hydrolase
MLIDLHAHSKGISKCSRIDGIDNIELAKSIGLDGFILTNHNHKQLKFRKNDQELVLKILSYPISITSEEYNKFYTYHFLLIHLFLNFQKID